MEDNRLTNQELSEVSGGFIENNERTVEVNRNNYAAVITSAGNVVIFAEAPFVGACNLMFANVMEFAEQNQDVVIGLLNVFDEINEPLTKQLGITTIPETLYYSNGVLINRAAGVIPCDRMKRMLI